MNTETASKSPERNRLEGFALTAMFQSVPTFVLAVLLIKLSGSHSIVRDPGGPVIFVVLASLVHATITPWLARHYPVLVKHGYEPLFFDASLSFQEKFARWRVQPVSSLQLVTQVVMLSVLALGVVSVG